MQVFFEFRNDLFNAWVLCEFKVEAADALLVLFEAEVAAVGALVGDV